MCAALMVKHQPLSYIILFSQFLNFLLYMKKTYFVPALKVEEAMAAQMLAESLAISDDPVDGGDALTKEDNSWDIWGDE